MQDTKKIRLGDTFVLGFAMFATFFGAGNMIFPPFLGNHFGDKWIIGFFCFLLADAGLTVLTVFAMVRFNGSINTIFERLGKKTAVFITTITMLIVGPAMGIPRTCATTFEMGMLPFFPEFSPWIFGLFFFGVVFVLIVGRSKVVDIIGKYLTPILLICLAVLIIKGTVDPAGEIISNADPISAANAGFLAGYQTMDVIAALAFTIVVLSDVKAKGYDVSGSSMTVVSRSSIITVIGMLLVYGGLCVLGATTSSLHMGHHNQAGLLVEITGLVMGSFGKVLLGIIVLFACLTTAVGLASSSSDFFFQLFKEKIPYKVVVVVVCGISYLLSNAGLSTMIAIATPMLNILYPLLLSQIILSFFNKFLKKDSIYKGAALGALIVCILQVAADYGAPTMFICRLPLTGLGLNWILPSAIGGFIGALLPERK